jgi:hypothetical protein
VLKADLPIITAALRDKFLYNVRELLGEDVSEQTGRRSNAATSPNRSLRAHNLEDLYDAMKFVPNNGTDWQQWNRLGLALYNASAGEELGLAAFYEFSLRHKRSAKRDCLQRWRDYANSPPSNIGAGTIFMLALENGYTRNYGFEPLDMNEYPTDFEPSFDPIDTKTEFEPTFEQIED